MNDEDLLNEYITCYEEQELLNGNPAMALVIILRTSGCSWSKKEGCLMCGYRNEAFPGSVPAEALLNQFKSAMENYKEQKIVKVFNSGSFLDDQEIPIEVRDYILNELSNRCSKIVVESRSEYVIQETVDQLKSIADKIEIAIGLESANTEINKLCINKGAGLDDYINAASILKKNAVSIRTYLLLKPPFLSEADAIEDVWHSMEKIKDHTDIISINPVNVQKGTLVERLWYNNQYRPPWFWSLIEILKRVRSWKDLEKPPVVISHPSGAKTRRGIHNCRKCDSAVLHAVKEFSLTQNNDIIDETVRLDCKCKEVWRDLIEYEKYSFASTGRLHHFD